ncbi:GNAT family N-acetyltransferase [Paracoccus aestuariivivens]|uniref:N-acetyltransferase n=1 Tax=Paracoccus aestuariivivens TaxID=1820333 RepID=A0A6L6JBT1_9RHOB|nr:GNAT family N-acetyltransferase [Paracoccus aestuariivivens]MTH78087.1 N-acetyltransferase [Paracoccus aestuariivivens]
MTDTNIEKADGPEGGRYIARISGIEDEGVLIYTHVSNGIVSADHTIVPETMAGRGVALALLDFLLEDARNSGFRIVPVCKFVRSQYARHPEWKDLFVTAPGKDP